MGNNKEKEISLWVYITLYRVCMKIYLNVIFTNTTPIFYTRILHLFTQIIYILCHTSFNA